MSIKTRRTEFGWTQEQLAQHSGLSTRTVQRLEQGQAATLESLKCLAAVFETDVKTLMEEKDMTQTIQSRNSGPDAIPDKESAAIDYVRNLKWFYIHLVLFAVLNLALFALNLAVSPGEWWIIYVILSWAAGLAVHAAYIFGSFGLFGAEWEQRQFRKRMGEWR